MNCDFVGVGAKEEVQCLPFQDALLGENLTQPREQFLRQVAEIVNFRMVVSHFLNAQLCQRLCSELDAAIKPVTFDLSSLSPGARRSLRFSFFLDIRGLGLAAWSAEQPPVRASLAVRRDCEPLLADLAVLKLTGQFHGLLIHFPSQVEIAVIVIVRSLLLILLFGFLLLCLFGLDASFDFVLLCSLALPGALYCGFCGLALLFFVFLVLLFLSGCVRIRSGGLRDIC
jgi:hypothetical protein